MTEMTDIGCEETVFEQANFTWHYKTCMAGRKLSLNSQLLFLLNMHEFQKDQQQGYSMPT